MKQKRLFLLLCILFASAAHSQTVDFSFSTSSGLFCNPQRVIFTQNCSGSPEGFLWNFGNGSSSIHGIDSVIYATAGTFTVTLTGLYADTAIVRTKTITINPAPTVNLSSNTDIICQPGNITFTANSSSSVASYEWNYGDGSPVEITASNVVTHSFPDYQDYTVIVKAITAFGCFATAPRVIRVQRFNITTVSPAAVPANGCIPITVGFNVSTDISAPDFAQSFLWNFDDGGPPVPGTANTITHLYNITDTVRPTVTITSSFGCVSTHGFEPSAYGTPPASTLLETTSGRDTFCGNEIIDFQAFAVNANFYSYQFGDGDISNAPPGVVHHQFRDTGWKKIIVTSFFNGCAGPKDSIDIYIEGVIAEFEYSNTCANKNVYFFENVSDGHISRFEWRFSDDPSIRDSIDFDVTHAFPVSGTSLVSLYLTDSLSGCSDTLHWNIFTAQPVFSVSNATVCKDSVITYSVNQTYSAASPYTYSFHVAGSIINNQTDSILHHYAFTHGSFNDYVIITDNIPETCDDTLHLSNITRVKGPVIDISAPARVCRNVPVVFTNNSHPFNPSDNITTWQWDFWDGTGSPVKDPPPHLYGSPGTYTVSLTATDVAACKAKKEISVIVDPIPEIFVYPRTDTICLGRDSATLAAYTIDNFVWIPASNISCNTCDTIKAYPSVTTMYFAKATNIGGCSSTDSSLVKVYAPINLQVSPNDFGVCPKIPVNYNMNSTGITTWSPGNILNDSTIANPVAITDSSVIFTVIVKDSAGCYADTSLVNLQVYPLPKVNAGPDLLLAYGDPFSLSPTYHASSQNYLWTPSDDLSCSSCPRPTGIALKAKTYKIAVTSDKGCKASDEINLKLICGNLLLPSAFTPGNGGPNDYFYPIARGYKSIKTFVIYNRYGNKVFERKNFEPNISTLGWDGSVKAVTTSGTQVFVWFVEGICEGGETVAAKGTVLLLR